MCILDATLTGNAVHMYRKMCAVCEVVCPFSPYHVDWASKVVEGSGSEEDLQYLYCVHNTARGGGEKLFSELMGKVILEVDPTGRRKIPLPEAIYGQPGGPASMRDRLGAKDAVQASTPKESSSSGGSAAPAEQPESSSSTCFVFKFL